MDYQRLASALAIIGLMFTASGLLGESRLKDLETRIRSYLYRVVNPARLYAWIQMIMQFIWRVANKLFSPIRGFIPTILVFVAFTYLILTLLLYGLKIRLNWLPPQLSAYIRPDWALAILACGLGLLLLLVLLLLFLILLNKASPGRIKVYAFISVGAVIILLGIYEVIFVVGYFLVSLVIVLALIIPFTMIGILIPISAYILIVALLSPYLFFDRFTLSLRLSSTLVVIGTVVTLIGLILQFLL